MTTDTTDPDARADLAESPDSTNPALAAGVGRRPLGPIGLAFATFILIGAIDGAVGVLLPSMGTHYAVDKATIGLIFPASSLGYLTAAFASGPLLERLGRRALLALGAAALGLGTLVISTMPPFGALLVPVALLGFGIGTVDAGLNAYIAGLPRSTGLLNYLHAFYGGGALLGPIIASGVLAASWGWNATYRIWALAGALALVGIVALFGSRERARERAQQHQNPDEHAGEHTGEHAAQGGVLRAALGLRVVWLAAIFLCVYVGAEVSLGSWSFTLLTEARGVPGLQASWMVSGYWLGLTLGRVALGHAANRIGARRIVLWCLAGVMLGMLAVWLAPGSVVAGIGLWLAGFCFGPLFPTTIALIGMVVPRRVQQSAIGFAASLGSLGGAAFPWLAGLLAGQVGLWTLLPYVIALSLAMLALWLALRPALGTAKG